ncbi:MAG: 2-hydroxyacyl-CoA dehydratase [Deltaproteobacteria bacterium]|jgi:benzoyl-CoA reductase/2-hydroxyglutaryl-CoA dehydratase subunit BcrC/BadD/HgdB|nr:MAG: 2-hydroxyacyl-CoA dehydratase [Deltaproteobacteria bacterium]
MGVEYKINRLAATNDMRPMVDRHWAELRAAKERGEKVAWASGPSFVFPYAMGMKCHFMAGYAAYCGGIGAADELMKLAEASGELPETCSYHRLHMGMVEAVKKEIPIKKPEAILPLPDLLVAGRYCTEQSHYSESFYRRMGIRVSPLELPFIFEKEDRPRLREFVYRQIKENVIPNLEEVCGKPFDYDRLSEIISVLKKAATIRNECWEFFKTKPVYWTLWDYAVSMAPVIYMMGDPESVPFYEKLLKELRERKEKGIPAMAPDGEKYRIYWDGWIPWAFLGKFMRKFTPNGAVCLCGRYPWEMFPHPELLDTEHPLETVADWMYGEKGLAKNMAPKESVEFIGGLIEEYSIDGLVMFSSKSCRMWNLSQMDVVDALDKRYGIPGVVIEADMIDPAMISDSQIDIRLQALFETIDGRRRR